MIAVKRDMPAPLVLDLNDPDSRASKELARAKTYFSQDPPTTPKVKFTAYADKTVRDALKVMFHRKCAYCETPSAAAQDCDIEHYRPKGKVSECKEPPHPGYWWLAMDWNNLMLSCMHCNQRRKQTLIEIGMTESQAQARIDAGDTETVGKLDSFPVENNKWLFGPDDDPSTETALLMDPTAINPEKHIEWLLHEDYSTLRAKNGSVTGQVSITGYALTRRYLVEQRTIHLKKLHYFGGKIISRINKISDATSMESDLHAEIIKDRLDDFKYMCRRDQPYAGLTRAYYRYIAKLVRDKLAET